MDLKDSVVNGGVLILHQVKEGKHQYEVENVVKTQKGSWKKVFVRKGDKLMQINGVDLEGLTPEELASMLAEGNPMLTVHKPGKKENPEKPPALNEHILSPVSKESTVLCLSWEMKRGEDGGEPEEGGGEAGEDGGEVEDVCKKVEEDVGGDLLVVEMKKISISLVRGRGCDPGSPCHGCNGSGCAFNDIVVVAESSTVTLVPRGGTFKQEKLLNVLVEHVPSQKYLRGVCSQKTVYASANPERITIYYYKSNILEKCFRGKPVVLNLTGSSCFLHCCRVGQRMLLQVEICEKQKLKQISKTDESTLSFVFYMKGDHSGHRTFESALHKGWFIHLASTDTVGVATQDGTLEEQSFLFIIQK